MKATTLIILFITNIIVLESKVLPEYLSTPCSKLTEDYQNCWLKTLRAWGPFLLKGVKEINFPKLSPLYLPRFMVNRTLNEFFKINAVLKDFKASGFDTTSIKGFQFDPHTKTGHLHLYIDQLYVSMEFEVSGSLFTVNVDSAGFFKGTASENNLLFDFKLKRVPKLGIDYFEFEDFKTNGTIGNAYIKLTSKNPEFQSTADLITNFFNEDPKRTLDLVQPVYAESLTYVYGGIVAGVLRTVPADEIMPELL